MEQQEAGRIRVGTSGWHYAHWRGRLYPADLRPEQYLSRYAEVFDTVEVNNTFYRLPDEETFRAWRATVPPGFAFAVKASRYITHMKKLKDPEGPLANVLGRAELLGPNLGPILFQLPPNWRFDRERLARFLAALPPGRRYAVEFRNDTWYNDAAYALLASHDVALCIHDMGGHQTPLQLTASFVYVRQHGPANSPVGHYTDEHLAWLAHQVQQWAAEGRAVYCYFNNDWEGHAVRDALALRSLLGARSAYASAGAAGQRPPA